jgi:hypothetical protein
MQLSDRRFARRFAVAKPVHFSVWHSSEPEQDAESVNISERGTYFETVSPPDVGATLNLRIEMPEEVSGAAVAEWQCIAKVVRAAPLDGWTKKVGVGIRLEFYEIVSGRNKKTRRTAKSAAGISGGRAIPRRIL